MYTEDTGTMTDITYPPNEVLVLSTSPRDQFSNTANYSPRNTTSSVFHSTLGYLQGSAMTDSPSYSMDNSPRDTQHQISLSSQISKETKVVAAATAAVGNTTNTSSSPVQSTATPKNISSRNSPGKEEVLRSEESQRKEAEENQLWLQKKQEEKAKADRAAEEKQLEEERKKQLLLAKLKAIDNDSQSASSQPEAKPTLHMEDTQPVKKKRLEDILNDGTTKDDEPVAASAAKPVPSKSNSLEEKRKKDLLAQLLLTDQPTSTNTQPKQTDHDAYLTDDGLTTAGSSTSVKSTSSTGSNYKWNTRIENMHQGKPAMATKHDPFGTRISAGLHKGSLNDITDSNTHNQTSNREHNDGGLDFLGGTGGVINTAAYHNKKKNTPTFGRRAVQKPHASVFGSDLTTKTDTALLSKKETVPTSSGSSKSYPWEEEINVSSEHSTFGYHTHNNASVDSSLLPRRVKAQPLNISSIPGQIDDDIEELSLV